MFTAVFVDHLLSISTAFARLGSLGHWIFDVTSGFFLPLGRTFTTCLRSLAILQHLGAGLLLRQWLLRCVPGCPRICSDNFFRDGRLYRFRRFGYYGRCLGCAWICYCYLSYLLFTHCSSSFVAQSRAASTARSRHLGRDLAAIAA